MNYVRKATDRETADYGAYSGMSRREFLRRVGAGLASGAALACIDCGGNVTTPVTYKDIWGTARNTLNMSEVLGGYNVSASNVSGVTDASGSYRLQHVMVPAELRLDGAAITRYKSTSGDLTDFDAIKGNFDVNNYRMMCMGIGVTYSNNVPPINPGSSVRFKPGIRIQPIVVKNPQIVQDYYDAFTDAERIFSLFTNGILEKLPTQFVDSASNIPEGGIVVTFGNPFGGAPREKSGSYIINSYVYAPIFTAFNRRGVQQSIEHEYGHAIGLDHSSDTNSLMYEGSQGNFKDPTQSDIAACSVKYRRNGGQTLDASADRD